MKTPSFSLFALFASCFVIAACSRSTELSRFQYTPSVNSVPWVEGDSLSYGLVYTFGSTRPDGFYPLGKLVLVNGYAYGTTQAGGMYGGGTVFELTSGSKDAVLHSFGSGSDGSGPVAGLIDVSGTLYGTTSSGGMYGGGTAFSITPDGKNYTVLYNFGKGPDASDPSAALIDVNGTLYGTTYNGGVYGFGTVFSMTTRGTDENVLHSFGYNKDGRHPDAELKNVGGTLYGTTRNGGDYTTCFGATCGTVFSITTAGKNYKKLHSFGKGTDGSLPMAGLIDVGGTLYGTTHQGGKYGDGSVFTVTTVGKENVLFNFGPGPSNGFYPDTDLTNISGTLYGTTSGGGAAGGEGTIFRITAGGKEKVLHTFGFGTDGVNPNAMINDSGILVGTTTYGGVYDDGIGFYLML